MLEHQHFFKFLLIISWHNLYFKTVYFYNLQYWKMNYRKKNLVELEYPVGGVAAVGGGGAVVPVPLHNVAPFHRLAIHNIHFTPFFTKISENI